MTCEQILMNIWGGILAGLVATAIVAIWLKSRQESRRKKYSKSIVGTYSQSRKYDEAGRELPDINVEYAGNNHYKFSSHGLVPDSFLEGTFTLSDENVGHGRGYHMQKEGDQAEDRWGFDEVQICPNEDQILVHRHYAREKADFKLQPLVWRKKK